MIEWSHDDLMHSLASWLRTDARMVWEDQMMGGMWSCRPDVFTMQKSYSSPNPIAYECKVSVSDFRSDITKAKWKSYLDFAYGVTFAVPKGLITKKDLPDGCGLIVQNGTCWHTVKRPMLNPVPLDTNLMLKLLIDGVRQLSKPQEIIPRDFNKWKSEEILRKKFGDDTANKLKRLDEIPERQAKVDGTVKHLKEILGLKEDASRWDVIGAIQNLEKLADPNNFADKINRYLDGLKRSIDNDVERFKRDFKKT